MFAWAPEWGWTFACGAPKSSLARAIARALAISGSTSASRGIVLSARAVQRAELRDARRVAAGGERSVEPGLEDLDRRVPRRDARAERQDVGVVVLAAEPRRVGVGAGGGADAGDLVGGHRHTEPGAAHEDAPAGLARRHGARDERREVGIVHGLGRLGAAIHDVVPAADQPRLEVLLEREPGMVGAERDGRHRQTISVGVRPSQATKMSRSSGAGDARPAEPSDDGVSARGELEGLERRASHALRDQALYVE